MRMDELDYDLPPERIAQRPAERRDDARLMVVRFDRCADGETIEHARVSELPRLLQEGDVMVLNDTKVLAARFEAVRESTGGAVEGLFVESRGEEEWQVMLKAGGRLRSGERLRLDAEHHLELVGKLDDGTWAAIRRGPLPTQLLLERVGHMPLPPYIRRPRNEIDQTDHLDRARYQTVYASHLGAVAAPTAGLHFTEGLLQQLRERGIETARLTLHVGPGTFAPVRTERLEAHAMHAERFTVPAATLATLIAAQAEGRRIIPVGTTSVRALESLPDPLPTPARDYTGETRLLIAPGFAFRFTDALMTNFHLPRSTLLALVAALMGLERLMRCYRVAIDEGYRFYSYGDAMLILPT